MFTGVRARVTGSWAWATELQSAARNISRGQKIFMRSLKADLPAQVKATFRHVWGGGTAKNFLSLIDSGGIENKSEHSRSRTGRTKQSNQGAKEQDEDQTIERGLG